MKTIKIFLASSEELDNDRMAFGNLVRRLDDLYEKRGIRVKLFEWEDYDAAYNNRRKQDEYNDKVRESDLFLALFYKKAGKFTIEEFNVAIKEHDKSTSPKVYMFCKDLKSGEVASDELTEFKKCLSDKLGYFWSRYDSRESLHFQFVMQLQIAENGLIGKLDVEDGYVMIDGMRLAPMDKLRFVAANEDYVKLNKELALLPEKIEKAKLRVEKYPDDTDLVDDLQQKQNQYHELKEELKQFQQLLFNTAKQVALLQGKHVTDRMNRAMNAFFEGEIHKANIILEEAEADAKQFLEDYLQSKEITSQKRQIVLNSIIELTFKASAMMADLSCPIEERITRVEQIYVEVDEIASVVNYDMVRYAELLEDYGNFLTKYAKYEKALSVYQRLSEMVKSLYGEDDARVAVVFNYMGILYEKMGNYSKALEFHDKALDIREKELGLENPISADSYNNIGVVYNHLDNNQNALEYHLKALNIYEKSLGETHPATADSYNNVGSIYDEQKDYNRALEYYTKALSVYEKVWGIDDAHTATAYNNIGVAYQKLGNYSKALEYYERALAIRVKTLGLEHPDTAGSYNNIGVVYEHFGDYSKALEYHKKVLNIYLKVYGMEHPFVADSYKKNAALYYRIEDYPKALEYHEKALTIKERAS